MIWTSVKCQEIIYGEKLMFQDGYSRATGRRNDMVWNSVLGTIDTNAMQPKTLDDRQ